MPLPYQTRAAFWMAQRCTARAALASAVPLRASRSAKKDCSFQVCPLRGAAAFSLLRDRGLPDDSGNQGPDTLAHELLDLERQDLGRVHLLVKELDDRGAAAAGFGRR